MNRPLLLISMILAAVVVAGLGQAVLAAGQEVQTPPPEVQDFVVQNKGNIATTVSNYGLIGGLNPYGYPSGEWPKGSGRDYLAEIKYWMGATIPGGDTALANTDDDFLPALTLNSAKQSRGICLSTDDSSFPYDETDTVGLGIGHPAYGWRVWDEELSDWGYNQIWDPESEQFLPGGPASLQESYYRFTDDALGSPALGLEISHTVYQWNYSYNEDFLFVVLEITNKSQYDYSDFAFGLYCDFDIGGPDGTGENGRLGDLVAIDTSMNLAWTYDADGYDRGWGPSVVTGVMGTRYIETPDNIGMTSFRTGQWENVPYDDIDRFAYISQNIYDDPIPPTDQYYMQCTSGIHLESGKTIRIGFALIAGYDEADFRAKAQMAQAVYNNHFIGPEPPRASNLRVHLADREVRLWWDGLAEASIDPMSQTEDFAGYKVYRSSDRGQSWGRLERHSDGSVGPDYVPLAIWRVDTPGEPIPHTFVDTTVTNGFEYWYSVVAFDKGDSIAGVGPLQTAYGRPGEDANAIEAIPRTDPAGYYDVEKTLVHQFSGAGSASQGEVIPLLFDEALVTGQDYELGFKETPYYTAWYVYNQTTGDTLINDQVDQSGDVAEAPVADGIRLIVKNGDREPATLAQTEFGSGATTLEMETFYGTAADAFGLPLGGDIHFRSAYELRFTQSGSQGYSYWDDVTPIDLPFEIWNTTTNEQVIGEIFHLVADDPVWDPTRGDWIVIVDIPYDGEAHPEAYPYFDAWIFRFQPEAINYAIGDVYEIGGAPVNGSGDKFVYKAPGIDNSEAAADLDEIRVVPNPYIGRADWQMDDGVRRLEFIHLPKEATVRIYTLAGDLVQTLQHDGSGTLVWDMLSVNHQAIAPGLYYYHVESPVGTRIGKFAVIK
jgi:hypothetical protein